MTPLRPSPIRRALARAAGALLVGPGTALAQDAPGESAMPEEVRWGAWGLIGLGLLVLAAGLLPPRPRGAAEEGRGLLLLRMLQRRIEMETTGWRRLQWPILGLFFIGLGTATLLGWR